MPNYNNSKNNNANSAPYAIAVNNATVVALPCPPVADAVTAPSKEISKDSEN